MLPNFSMDNMDNNDSQKRVSLIIPVFNEENTLGDVLSEALRNAEEERFFLLNAFLKEPDRLMNLYAKARGVEEYDASRLPFFIVYEKEGWWIREELRREHDTPKDVKMLVDHFRQNGVASMSIVPKILPLIVQLRSLGTIYLTDPPYLTAAQRFSEALGIAQHPILSVSFDLTRILEKKIWRALLRDFHKRFSGSAFVNTHWCDTYWRHHPTLTLYEGVFLTYLLCAWYADSVR